MPASPIDISFVNNESTAGGILWVGYPDQDGGDAITQVIFGDYNPAGRTPFTWYPKEYADQMSMTDMNMRANASENLPRTYKFYMGRSLYEFGHGLSYSSFSEFIASAPATLVVRLNSTPSYSKSILLTNQNFHSNAQANAIDVSSVNCTSFKLDLVIGVRNRGLLRGGHVVLVFWKPPTTSDVTGGPNVQLVGSERVTVRREVKHGM